MHIVAACVSRLTVIEGCFKLLEAYKMSRRLVGVKRVIRAEAGEHLLEAQKKPRQDDAAFQSTQTQVVDQSTEPRQTEGSFPARYGALTVLNASHEDMHEMASASTTFR